LCRSAQQKWLQLLEAADSAEAAGTVVLGATALKEATVEAVAKKAAAQEVAAAEAETAESVAQEAATAEAEAAEAAEYEAAAQKAAAAEAVAAKVVAQKAAVAEAAAAEAAAAETAAVELAASELAALQVALRQYGNLTEPWRLDEEDLGRAIAIARSATSCSSANRVDSALLEQGVENIDEQPGAAVMTRSSWSPEVSVLVQRPFDNEARCVRT
jgi:hypothetical protein